MLPSCNIRARASHSPSKTSSTCLIQRQRPSIMHHRTQVDPQKCPACRHRRPAQHPGRVAGIYPIMCRPTQGHDIACTHQVLQLGQDGLSPVAHANATAGISCATLAAAPLITRHLATGSLDGTLHMWDSETLTAVLSKKGAHAGAVNTIDGCGGAGAEACRHASALVCSLSSHAQGGNHGACEVVTGGQDGCVHVWDPRCADAPVVSLHPTSDRNRHDCWAVCFGNAHSVSDRCVASGYANGNVKLFDLRANALQWDTHVGHGICALQVR